MFERTSIADMLYHILATLWDEPHNLDSLVSIVTERTGEPAAPEVIDGHMWFLFQFGFVETYAGETPGALYAITPRGSELLAASAEQFEMSAG